MLRCATTRRFWADPQSRRCRVASAFWKTVKDARGASQSDLIGSPFHIDGAPKAEPRCPPGLGADTEAQVLEGLLGLDKARIAELLAKGIIAESADGPS